MFITFVSVREKKTTKRHHILIVGDFTTRKQFNSSLLDETADLPEIDLRTVRVHESYYSGTSEPFMAYIKHLRGGRVE